MSYFNIIIKIMQEESKKLYKITGKILADRRKELGIKYTDFCYGNDIPMSTYDVIISGSAKSSFYNIAKVVKASKMTFKEFGEALDNNLPDDFLNSDN